MSEARTVWHALEAQRNTATKRRRFDLVIAVCLLCAMATSEVLFLKYVAGADSANLMAATEGIAVPP